MPVCAQGAERETLESRMLISLAFYKQSKARDIGGLSNHEIVEMELSFMRHSGERYIGGAVTTQ
jgi:hypothetical protein